MEEFFTLEKMEYIPFNTTEIYNPSDDWLFIVILVIAPLGLIGNSLVLWLLGFRSRRNPFSVYILNLAAADFMFLCSVLLLHIESFPVNWNRNFVSGIVSVSYLSYCAGLSLLSAISTERCLSVLFPIWYKCHRPMHTSAAVCTLLWTLGVLFALLYHFLCDTWNFCRCSRIIPIMWFSLLTLVMCVSSLRSQPPRLYGLGLFTVLVFVLCGLPAGFDVLVPSNFFLQTLWLPPILACVNSSANPFIYFFLGSQRCRRGREPLRVVLQRALGREEDLEDGSRDAPHNNTLEISS